MIRQFRGRLPILRLRRGTRSRYSTNPWTPAVTPAKLCLDSAGIKRLDDLIPRGATISGCSGFIVELLGVSRG
jgi:hypothetical protein